MPDADLAASRTELSVKPFICLALFGIALNIILFVWPLSNIGSLYTSIQDPDFSDQNFYLYYARELCASRDLTIDDYYITWSSTGVMYYLTGLCRVTGSALSYAIVNPILFAGSVYLLAKELCARIDIPRIRWGFLFGFPHTVYLMALPGKEILSWMGAALVIYGLMLFSRPRPNHIGAAISALAGLIVLIANRPHELAILCTAMVLFFPLKNRFIPIGGAFIMGAVLLVSSAGASDMISLILTQASDRENVGVADQYGGALSSLELILSSDNEFVHALLSPFRALFLYLSPFSIAFRSIQFGEINYFVFREVAAAIKLVDCVTAGVIILAFLRDRTSNRNRRLLMRAMIATWALSLIAITYPGLQQKSRYLFQYFPMVMLAGLISSRKDQTTTKLLNAPSADFCGR